MKEVPFSFLKVPESILQELGTLTPLEVIVYSLFLHHYNFLCKKNPDGLALLNMESEIYGEDVEVPYPPNDRNHPFDESKVDTTQIQFFFKMGYLQEKIPSVKKPNLYRTITSLVEKGYLAREDKILNPDSYKGMAGARTLYRILKFPGLKSKETKVKNGFDRSRYRMEDKVMNLH